jgi:hypothetical protein
MFCIVVVQTMRMIHVMSKHNQWRLPVYFPLHDNTSKLILSLLICLFAMTSSGFTGAVGHNAFSLFEHVPPACTIALS